MDDLWAPSASFKRRGVIGTKWALLSQIFKPSRASSLKFKVRRLMDDLSGHNRFRDSDNPLSTRALLCENAMQALTSADSCGHTAAPVLALALKNRLIFPKTETSREVCWHSNKIRKNKKK